MRFQTFFPGFSYCLLFLEFIMGACNRPECKNTNPVFDQYSPGSQQYNAELLRQLQAADPAKLTYRFSEYVESNGQELLYFNVQGEELCALMVLKVDNWNKLELLRQKKGLSFRGAEFKKLTYQTIQDSAGIRFVYRDVDRIID